MDKGYIFQQTSCLPELKLKTTAVRRRKLPPPRPKSAYNHQRCQRGGLPSTNLSDSLPQNSPFQPVVIPQYLEVILYPHSALVESQSATSMLGTDDLGRVMKIFQNCTFNELKMSILNGILCQPSSSGNSNLLSKAEYTRRLKLLRLWSLDPAFSSQRWVQLRNQSDWEKVKVLTLMESRSQERVKLMFDESCEKSSHDVKKNVDDSITVDTHPSHDTDNFSLDPFDTEQQRPRPLRLLSQKPPNKHYSPEKQQNMAKILEQRILLSRI